MIQTRQREDFRRAVRLEEAKVRILASATYGAANNRAGARAAGEIEMLERDKAEKRKSLPSAESVVQTFGGVDPRYGLYSEEQIRAEAERLKAEGLVADG